MSRPTVALCMIVKNEAENLPRLFKSIEGCFDEIHLTDTGSTDNTVELAKSLGAQVHHFEWCDDFAAARNASMKPATTDFIMWLDGDDVLEGREGFLAFREDVLTLADYWIANYHYTSTPEGKSLCTFVRERLFRRDREMKWLYPIHEGVKPISDVGPVRMQMTTAWAVRHMRTDADLLKDRSRNLSIFEALVSKGPLDPRMRYYYGKELFEAQKPLEAFQVLSAAIVDRDLELHDRILGFQYSCYCAMQLNQFAKALELAHQGSILSPHRAEFHCIIGDCHIKLGQMLEAIPFYSAAKSCIIGAPSAGTGAIFNQEDCYQSYPRNNLARVYAHLGDLDRAKIEAKESWDKYGSADGKAILDELERITVLSAGFQKADPCEDIVISCPPQSAYEFDPGIAEKKAMGGSETALIEMAYWLKKLSGRRVIVFNMRQLPGIFDGVEYLPANGLAEYMAKHKPWLHIAWRHTLKITDAPTFIWSHDLQTPGVENTKNYVKALCLTPFHKRFMAVTQGVPQDKMHVTRNGLKPERFEAAYEKADPFRFVFGSSPDRGLDRCIRVLSEVRKTYPKVTLHIHYGFEHFYPSGNPDLIKLADQLKVLIADNKDWITYHGATQQQALMESYKASAYVCQPSDWIETSCISAMEFLACGVYPIFRRVGGVADTLGEAEKAGMATLVDSDCLTDAQYDKYVQAVLKAIEEKAYLRVKIDPKAFSWEKVATEWLRDLPDMAGYGEMRKVGGI